MSHSSSLYRLQLIDSQRDQNHSRLTEIEAILKDDHIVQEAAARLQEAESMLGQQRKLLRDIENQVNDQRYKIEQNESSLYSGRIQNPKELQDLQNDVASLKRYLNILEDRQLEMMVTVEESETVYDSARTAHLQSQGTFEEQNAHLRAEKTRLEESQARLIIEHQAACSSIPETEMEVYEQLRRIRRGVAVSRITDRMCSACGSTLTPALIQAASAAVQLARCSGCGRILYAG
jgi:hypothetical protein